MRERIKPLLLFLSIFCSSLATGFSQTLQEKLAAVSDDQEKLGLALDEFSSLQLTAEDSTFYKYYKARHRFLKDEFFASKSLFLEVIKKLDPKRDKKLILAAYYRLSDIESFNGQWDKALSQSQAALEYARSQKDTNAISHSLSSIAVVHHDMENYQTGVKYGKEGHQLLMSYPKADAWEIAFGLTSIAINFDDANQMDSALYYHYQIMPYLARADSGRISFVFNNIANSLIKKGSYDEAIQSLDVAVKLDMRTQNSYRLASVYTNLATAYYRQGDFGQSAIQFDSAYKYTTLSQSTEKLRDYYQEQYRFQKIKGSLPQAMEYLEKYHQVRDSVFKADRIRMMGELEAEYEVELNQRELAESKAALIENELLVKDRTNLLLLLLILLLLLFGVSSFIYYKQKVKNQNLEQEAKIQAIYAEQKMQSSLLDQRNRISADLHDNIGAQLTFIVSSLNHLKYVQLSRDAVAAKLDQISAFTVDTVSELRDTIWAMNKDHVSLEDLESRILNFVGKAKDSCPQIVFHLEISDKLRKTHYFNSLEGVNYFRVAQEAINNAIKHSNASVVEVRIDQESDSIRLSVIDNGKGFGQMPAGNGLGTMRNRAERIGKTLSITSLDNQGTQVSIS